MLDFNEIFEDCLVELEFPEVLDEELSGPESTRLRNLMKKSVVTFRYTKKKDGEERIAHGTLQKKFLPRYKTEKRPKYNPDKFIYWDTDRKQFRSFMRDNFIEIMKDEPAKPDDGGDEETND